MDSGLISKLVFIDKEIVNKIKDAPTGFLIELFWFFNSPTKPLEPTEFLQFWFSLSWDEKKHFYMTGEIR